MFPSRHTIIGVGLGLVLTALAPASASASKVAVSDSFQSITYKALRGETNRVTVYQDGDTYTIVDPGTSIDISTAAGHCTQVDSSQVICVVPTSYALKVDVGDLNDSAAVSSAGAAKIDGGPGNDALAGGAGDDNFVGGDGNDRMRGGPGADHFIGDGGGPAESGAADVVDYSDRTQPVTVTPDGIGNDGAVGEGDDIETDIESSAGGSGNDHLTVNAAGGMLTGGAGADTLEGSAAADVLDGGEGNDTFIPRGGPDEVFSRDSVAENVSCGDDADSVTADFADVVGTDCETVQRSEPPPPPSPSDPTSPGEGSPSDPDAPPGIPRSDTPGDTSEPVDGGGTLPAPVVGETVNVASVSGVILIRPPGAQRFDTLRSARKIPVGSLVDTRRGLVKLTSARTRTGRTQTAVFTGARFRVRQRTPLRPVTELVLSGDELAGCGAALRRASSPTVQASARRRGRRLWGSGHGRFTTRGRHGSATVRGTVWSVEDRCDGTLTTVARGLVAVRDYARRRTVLVGAGGRYLARARR